MTKSKTQKKDEQSTSESVPLKQVKTVKSKEAKESKQKETTVKSTKAKSVPKEKKSKDDSSKDDKVLKRSFKGVYVNCEGVVVLSGRYCGKKPMQAARKALTGIYRRYKNYNKEHPKSKKSLTGKVYFGVKETSQQSKHKKIYWYVGEKLDLDVPHERVLKTIDPVTGKNKVISHKSKNDVKKASVEDCKHLLQYFEEDDDDEKPKKRSVKKPKQKKDVKEGKETKTKEPKTKDPKTKDVKETKSTKDTKVVKDAKVAKDTKDTKVAKDVKPKTKKN